MYSKLPWLKTRTKILIMNTVTCPICNGENFGSFAGRLEAQCLTCMSLERGRAVHLCLQKLGLPRSDDRILHFAPEKCLMDVFSQTHGEKYQPADLFPQIYKHPTKKVRRIDICEDLYSLPSDEWDLILHNHVLEHLFCSVKGVLRGFERILKPGGSMIFTIPIWKGRTTIEDLNPHLSDADRLANFGQKDHVRLFGGDVVDLIENALGVNCFIPITTLFTKNEFQKAGIPWKPENEPNPNSIFLYKKNDLTN